MLKASPNHLQGDRIDVLAIVNQPLFQKQGERLHVFFIKVRRKIVRRVFLPFQMPHNLIDFKALHRPHDVREAGVMRAGAICTLHPLVIPAVALRTAPGIRTGTSVRRLPRPDRHIPFRRVHSQYGIPAIV
ncbi:MAG: hypothetical protein D6770_10740 [Anaerolineae bacterium]|nr:MAG: hypothetical protein D6770_10740 [Anaerolineae bacterium]